MINQEVWRYLSLGFGVYDGREDRFLMLSQYVEIEQVVGKNGTRSKLTENDDYE
ncbi:hypothetical protein Q9251_10445 [Alkalihalobacillus macyae]|uniref:hypothetical protein n=1 Tax=Guptibacillus hwajinpoensis TaxID=208199 RepID=UPI00273B983B|nr:hypothetical protein [Alkalihalobacillus macyae]MDP4551309.1 hypothetical protein [Alkalihalobacillus macyae]